MAKFFIALATGVLTVSGAAYAQEVSSADVNIVSITATGTASTFTCTAEINNQNDDDSRQTKVIVLLPLQVAINAMSIVGGHGKCQKGPLLGGFSEFAVCSLGSLPQGQAVRRTVQIQTTRSTAPANIPQTCSAFIYSSVGDIQKNNNYAVAVPVP